MYLNYPLRHDKGTELPGVASPGLKARQGVLGQFAFWVAQEGVEVRETRFGVSWGSGGVASE